MSKESTVWWTTMSGKKIPIKNMGTQHIINTISMLHRRNRRSVDKQILKDLSDELERRQKDEPNQLLKELL